MPVFYTVAGLVKSPPQIPLLAIVNGLPVCASGKLGNIATVVSGRPTESRKGSTVFHNHGSQKFVVRASLGEPKAQAG